MPRCRFAIQRMFAGFLPCLLPIIVGGAIGLYPSLAQAQTPSTGGWTGAGTLTASRSGAEATTLQDGRILITGGTSAGVPLSSAEIYDGNTFTAISSMSVARSQHTIATLSDGRVVVAGGYTATNTPTNSIEIFDPASNTWSSVPGGLTQARAEHTMTALLDGRLLIAGGMGESDPLASLEIFDPKTNTSVPVDAVMSSPRMDHAAALLPNGAVMLAGGFDGKNVLASVDAFNPATDGMINPLTMASRRRYLSATSLLDGRVLIAGGNDGTNDLATLEIANLATGAISLAGSLSVPRSHHSSIRLPDNGGVLIVGGLSAGTPVASAEFYSPVNGSIRSAGSMSVARFDAAIAWLGTPGKDYVLVAGGESSGTSSSGDLYSFPILRTDKPDYAPNTPVTVTGTGWAPGETVTLVFHEIPAGHPDVTLTSTADGTGSFQNTSFKPDVHDENINLLLTGTGAQSGSTAQTIFADATYATQLISFTAPSSGTVNSSVPVQATLQYGVPQYTPEYYYYTCDCYSCDCGWTSCDTCCNTCEGVNNVYTGTDYFPLPGETVQFYFNSGPAITAVTDSNGVASASISVQPGSTTLTAYYGGSSDGTYGASQASLAFTANTAPTTLVIQLATATYGDASVPLTATLTSSGNPVANELVSFLIDGTPVGSGTTNSSGVAAVLPAIASLGAGSHTVTAVFSGDASYAGASAVAALVVNPAVPVITWNNPADIVYGTPLGSSQLNATATFNGNPEPGTFTYSPLAGTVLNAGLGQTLSVSFAPTDAIDFSSVAATATINVQQATPIITWSNPADITSVTPLSSTQLDASILPPNAAGFWPAEEGTGTTSQNVLTSETATLLNGASWGPGKVGTYAFSLNGAQQQYVDAGNTPDLQISANDFTVATWVNFSNLTGNESIVNKMGSQASFNDDGWKIYKLAGNQFEFCIGQGFGTDACATGGVQSVTTAVANTWYHVAAVKTGTNITIYVNGQPENTTSVGAISDANDADLRFGSDLSQGEYLSGEIDEVLLFSRALTPTEIQNVFAGTQSTHGTFAYVPAAGTTLPVGSGQTLSTTFTPIDSIDFNTATVTTTINVTSAAPVVSWAQPAPITYGTPLSSTQLNATANVQGTFTYTPALGTVLTAGSQPIQVTFSPTDSADYVSASATVTLQVNQAPASVTPNPASKTYGQSDPTFTGILTGFLAADDVTATYSRTPGETVAGSPDAINATLSPSSALSNYSITYNTGAFTIAKANASVTPNSATKVYGTPDPALTGVLAGFLPSDNVTGTYSRAPGETVAGSPYTISAILSPAAALGNYSINYNTASFTITQATPTLSWTATASITYGTALSAAQLDATASVPGGFTYSPAVGTVLSAGTHTLTANFTPTDTSDYSTPQPVTVSITVTQATPTLSWTAPASITYGTALTAAQLDATASVPGGFTYSPTLGTVLSTGTHTLTANFTPTDTSDYRIPQPVTTSITVSQPALNVTANNASRTYGTSNPTFSGAVTGAVNGDTFTEGFSTTAMINSNAGSYPIVPTVTGTDLADYSVSIEDGTLTVAQAATTTSLSVSGTSTTPGQSTTLTAQVASVTTGTPTGTVSFYDGNTLLGTATLSAGSGTYSTSSLAAGVTHTLTAMYGGDVNFLASNASASIVVVPLDFTLTLSSPASETVVPGSAASYQLAVDPLYGSYAGPVSFTASGLPPGATVLFSPATIPANGGKQTLTVSIQTAGVASMHSLPSASRMAPLALALLLLPLAGARRMQRQGRRLSGMLMLILLLGSLSASVILTGCGSRNGFFAHPVQSYNVTITASAGNLQHSATITVEVQ